MNELATAAESVRKEQKMNAFEFGITYLHDQLEIMIDSDLSYQSRMKELKALKLKNVDMVNEYLDLKKEHEILEEEIFKMIEFISFVRFNRKEYQKKKNAGAKATDKEKLTNKIITEMKENANTYSLICSGGAVQ